MSYGIGDEKSEKDGNNWGGLVGGALGIASGFAGRLFARQDDARQLKQQAELNKQTVASQKEMADYNYKNQLSMWEATSYGAQKEQMEKAGLNPALMYGQGGGGGVTTGGTGGTGASGGQAANSAATSGAATQQGMGMMQAAMMTAQTENIKADTAKKEVEATKMAGVDTENVAANTGLTNVKARFAEIETQVAGKTQNDAIRYIVEEANKMGAEANIKANDQTISDSTMKEQRTIVQQEAIGAILKNAATRTSINLDQAKINEISQTLMQKWEQLKLGKEGLQVARDNMEQLTEAMLWGAGIQAGGNIVRGVMDIATKGGGGTVSQTIRDNFDGTGHTTTTRTTPIR